MTTTKLTNDEGYHAPECEELVLGPDTLLLTSVKGSQVDPGEEEDWGEF